MKHEDPHGFDGTQGGDWSQPQHPEDPWNQQGYGQARHGQPQGRRSRGRFGRAHAVNPGAAAFAPSEERKAFIQRTYMHLAAAIFACVAMMSAFMMSPFYEPVMVAMVNTNWIFILVIFLGVSWVGDSMARNSESRGLQYIGLLVSVGAYAIILALPVTLAAVQSGPQILIQALIVTGLTFGALTVAVLASGKDFSILRNGLIVAGVLAFGAIAAGSIFGFSLGLGFFVFMVGLSVGMIVYQTSSVLHTYSTDNHVGAALALFASIGMLFWYILSIFMSFDG